MTAGRKETGEPTTRKATPAEEQNFTPELRARLNRALAQFARVEGEFDKLLVIPVSMQYERGNTDIHVALQHGIEMDDSGTKKEILAIGSSSYDNGKQIEAESGEFITIDYNQDPDKIVEGFTFDDSTDGPVPVEDLDSLIVRFDQKLDNLGFPPAENMNDRITGEPIASRRSHSQSETPWPDR